jgi:hypothetical protein
MPILGNTIAELAAGAQLGHVVMVMEPRRSMPGYGRVGMTGSIRQDHDAIGSDETTDYDRALHWPASPLDEDG